MKCRLYSKVQSTGSRTPATRCHTQPSEPELDLHFNMFCVFVGNHVILSFRRTFGTTRWRQTARTTLLHDSIRTIRDRFWGVWQAGAYVLDFLGPAPKLSVKNVQLVLAADDHPDAFSRSRCPEGSNRRRNGRGNSQASQHKSSSLEELPEGGLLRPRSSKEEEGGWWAGEDEITLLSLGKSGRDSFSLDYRWPLTPMQAFGLALAALDTGI